jgi:uncharacterized protein YndB with AHSA1/START domain
VRASGRSGRETKATTAMTEHLIITRLLPATPERVFAACTRPELLAQWLTCVEDGEATATAEPRVGGPFRIEMRRRGA